MSNKRVATNWESKDTWERLVAAIIASGVKLDLREIAKFYGTTYDTLENRLRKIKKDAAVLKEEVETGERAEVVTSRTAPNTPKKPRTPKTPKSIGGLDAVVNGRISKTSPSKRSKTSPIKQEMYSTDESFMTDTSIFNTGAYLHGTGGDFDLSGFGGENGDMSSFHH